MWLAMVISSGFQSMGQLFDWNVSAYVKTSQLALLLFLDQVSNIQLQAGAKSS
jgi:hypothetical protein